MSVTKKISTGDYNIITATNGNVNITTGNVVVKKLDVQTVSLGSVSGNTVIDVSAGNYQTFSTNGNVTLSFTKWPSSNISSSVTLDVNVTSLSHNIVGPTGIDNSFGIVGLNYATSTMSFPKIGHYIFTFSSINSGGNISISENNTILVPYNSSAEAITNTSNASIDLGTTYSLYVPSPLSSAGTAFLANGVPGQTKILGSLGSSTWDVTVPGAIWGGSKRVNFNAANQNITLVWSTLGYWLVLNSYGNVTLS